MIGVVQFRSTSLDVEQSNPVNKDFENMINSDDDEFLELFQNGSPMRMIVDLGLAIICYPPCN